MPEVKKSTVVIASVLKPVDDPRMYEKIGLSLFNTNLYEVHLIGVASTSHEDFKIKVHTFKPFRRVSLGRLIAPWRILVKAIQLKPDILLITTHELLYLALLMKFIYRCKIIYDVQENYYWNILYTPAFPSLIKPFIAVYVRCKETLTARFIDYFFLAEKGYADELQFPGNKKTVLENKVRISDADKKKPATLHSKNPVNMIFTGTLAETTGVFTAIDLTVKLHMVDERFRLTIIGYCAQPQVREKILRLIKSREFIELISQDSPIPHSEILQQIRKADFGMITYEINPSTMNAIPTKLYEYLGYKLPILLVNHKAWVDFCQPYSAAVVFDRNNIHAAIICKEMMQKNFYTTEPIAVYWETEEPKLLGVFEGLSGTAP